MCGIAGCFRLNDNQSFIDSSFANKFISALSKRGPDSSGMFLSDEVLLTHTRLSIIDTHERSSQPMISSCGNFIIVLNGEVFNFKSLKFDLINKGYIFKTESDTEVVLNLFIEYGFKMLELMSGFFALAIFDKSKNELVLARDRFGIKPLLIFQNENFLFFASEMKAIIEASDKFELDHVSLRQYFRFTYIPPPYTIFKNVRKLESSTFLIVNKSGIKQVSYIKNSEIESHQFSSLNYNEAQKKLKELLIESVNSRLVSDVPLGCFLSGGIDSSIVTAIAAKSVDKLKTFTIGFKDNQYYDETKYANLLARKYNTDHEVFSLSNQDLYENIFEMLDYIDEPFADSSALAFYILSKETSKHVKVALSGDGADELLGGYRKHMADYRINGFNSAAKSLVQSLRMLKYFPQSRSNSTTDKIRKIYRLAQASSMTNKERYLFLSSFNERDIVDKILKVQNKNNELTVRENELTSLITDNENSLLNVLLSDQSMVLQGDMLFKVDSMSMANSLEVRPPFLDEKLVEFANSLPDEFKIQKSQAKKILRDAFRKDLIPEIIDRPKHGFEVPMDNWIKNELKNHIINDLLEKNFVMSQGIYNFVEINKLLYEVFNNSHHNRQALIWSIIVFQFWWKKYESKIKLN